MSTETKTVLGIVGIATILVILIMASLALA